MSCRFSVQVTAVFRTRRPGPAGSLDPTTQDRKGGAVAGGRRSEGVPTGTRLTPEDGMTWRSGWMTAVATATGAAGEAALPVVLQEPMHWQLWE
jgi:hypothetical protein